MPRRPKSLLDPISCIDNLDSIQNLPPPEDFRGTSLVGNPNAPAKNLPLKAMRVKPRSPTAKTRQIAQKYFRPPTKETFFEYVDLHPDDPDCPLSKSRRRVPQDQIGPIELRPKPYSTFARTDIMPPVLPPTPEEAQNLKDKTEKRVARRRKAIEMELDKFSNAFIESLGPLEDLKQALAQSESPKVQNFLTALVSPMYRKWTVTTVARHCGISSATLADIWRSWQHSKGMLKIINGIPKVSEDIVKDSESSEVCCPRCDGWKKITRETVKTLENFANEQIEVRGIEELECPQCKGQGIISKSGDKDARKLMFEAAGIIKSGAGQNININIRDATVESVLDEIGNDDVIDIRPEPS